MKLYLMDMDEATMHESSRNVGHPAITWPFSKVFTDRSGTGKTNIPGIFLLVTKVNVYIKRKRVDPAIYSAMI